MGVPSSGPSPECLINGALDAVEGCFTYHMSVISGPSSNRSIQLTNQVSGGGLLVVLTLSETGEEMATRVRVVETTLYGFIAQALEGQPLSESIALLWHLVKGRPTGEALARRIWRAHEAEEREGLDREGLFSDKRSPTS
jgi:hypothetical protein